jgi:hypothetical protein
MPRPASGSHAPPRSYLAQLALPALLATACVPGPAEEMVCGDAVPVAELPPVLVEASGLAASRALPGVLWVHNDSGHEPLLFAIDTLGQLLATVRVAGAVNVDWEDLALAPCPGGGDCLLIGDIGDNLETRDDVVLYRVAEPALTDTVTAPAEAFVLRYPDRPRDAESLFVLPDGHAYIVGKGRNGPVEVFRAPLRAAGSGTMTAVAEILPQPPIPTSLVTGAASTPDGRWLAVRTYTRLHLFRVADGRFEAALDSLGHDLTPAGEPQGEAVELLPDGTVWLAGERRNGIPAPLARLSCTLR